MLSYSLRGQKVLSLFLFLHHVTDRVASLTTGSGCSVLCIKLGAHRNEVINRSCGAPITLTQCASWLRSQRLNVLSLAADSRYLPPERKTSARTNYHGRSSSCGRFHAHAVDVLFVSRIQPRRQSEEASSGQSLVQDTGMQPEGRKYTFDVVFMP